MGGLVFSLLVVAAVVAWLLKRRAAGRSGEGADGAGGGVDAAIVFRQGLAAEIRGRIPRSALSAFEDIAAEAELTGEVRMHEGGVMSFDESIPPGVRQQLRNAWATSRHVH